MIDLIFDTETTGIDTNDRVIQLGCVLREDSKNIATVGLAVFQEKEIHEKAYAVHGISAEHLETHGLPALACIKLFNRLAATADRFLAFNAPFDVRMIRQECSHLGIQEPFGLKPVYCVMRSATEVCKIPAKYPGRTWKWPTLLEAYCHLVDEDGPPSTHDALHDVLSTIEISDALEELGVHLEQV